MITAWKITDAGDTCPHTSITVTFNAMVPPPGGGDPVATVLTKVCNRIPWDPKYDRGEYERGHNDDYEDMPPDSFVAVKQSGGATTWPPWQSRQSHVFIYGGCLEHSAPADPQVQFFTDGDPTPDEIFTDPVPGPDFGPFDFNAPAFTGGVIFSAQVMVAFTGGTGQPYVPPSDPGDLLADPPRPPSDDAIAADPWTYSSDYFGKCDGGGPSQGISWTSLLPYPDGVTDPATISLTDLIITEGSNEITFADTGDIVLTPEMYISHAAFLNGVAKIVSASTNGATLGQAAFQTFTAAGAGFGYWCSLVRTQGFNGTCNAKFSERSIIPVKNPQTRTRSRIVKHDGAPGIDALPGRMFRDSPFFSDERIPNQVTRIIDPRTFEVAGAGVDSANGINLDHCIFTEGSAVAVCDSTAELLAASLLMSGGKPVYAPIAEWELVIDGIPIWSGVDGSRRPEFQIIAILSDTTFALDRPATRTAAPAVLCLTPYRQQDTDFFAYVIGGPVQEGDDPAQPAARGKPHGTVDIGAPSDPGTPPAFVVQVS